MWKICYSLDEREKYLKDELESVTEEASKYFYKLLQFGNVSVTVFSLSSPISWVLFFLALLSRGGLKDMF